MSKHLDPIKAAQAASALKDSINALCGADGEDGSTADVTLLIDMVEGETDFFEAVDRILERIQDDHAMVASIEAQIDALKLRKERFKKRAETNKALLEQAFIVADLPKVERPLGTLFLSNRAPSVIIETESDIPAKFWKPADPVLDKKALTEALRARRAALDAIPSEPGEAREKALAQLSEELPDIPGVTLSNGSRSLSIRTA